MVGWFRNGRLDNTGFLSVVLRHSQNRMVGWNGRLIVPCLEFDRIFADLLTDFWLIV